MDRSLTPRAPWDTRDGGSYVLALQLQQHTTVVIGRRGTITLPAGCYLYAGSALGGLGARLRRHLQLEKRHHWHIDALRAVATVQAIHYRVSPDRLECTIARALLAEDGASVPAPGFGSSDCRCPTHLIGLQSPPMSLPGWNVWRIPVQPEQSSINKLVNGS